MPFGELRNSSHAQLLSRMSVDPISNPCIADSGVFTDALPTLPVNRTIIADELGPPGSLCMPTPLPWIASIIAQTTSVKV
jgi:hypothetical protein